MLGNSASQLLISFRTTKQHSNADRLSRLPLNELSSIGPGNPQDPAIFNICQVAALLVNANALQVATHADPVLSKALVYVRRRWPDQTSTCFKPFKKIRNELNVEVIASLEVLM